MERTGVHVVRALTVAGSDSGGGAGIQADLKTFAAFGVYGSSVVTAVTAQNTLGVQDVCELSPDIVTAQLASVFADIGADAVKTGMLGNADIVRATAEGLARNGVRHLVVDPVMVAKGGQPLLHETAVRAVREELLPLAEVITPNLPEAEALCGFPLRTFADWQRAAADLAQCGARVVVVKGGHAAGKSVVDLVYDGSRFTTFRTDRIDTHKTHGTGCTFSAGVAAGLARGLTVLDAVATAKAFVTDAIAAAADWDVGAGHGPTDHSVMVHVASGMVSGCNYRRAGSRWILEEASSWERN